MTTAITTSAPAVALRPAEMRAAIAAVMMTILLGALDQSIVSVAVPTIAGQLGGFEWMAWVISAYLIASTVVTPLYGSFSDQFGRRLAMSVAIALFLLGSVGCALAQTLPQLVLMRVLQGAGGGGLISTGQSVIADVVPMRERGRYQSYISIVWAVSSVAGPVVGGLLTQFLSWPWIFWINLPVGVLAYGLVRMSLAKLPAARPSSQRIDIAGALLLLAGLTALLLPITRIGQGVALTEPANAAGLLLAALLLATFGWHERRVALPILPVALLRQRTVVVCSAMLFVCFFVFIALTVLVPLRLQLVLGLAPGEAAVRLLPLTLGIPIAAFVSGRYTHRTGQVRPLQRLGVALVPLGLAALAFVPPGATAAASAAMLLMGVGFGLQMPTTLLTVQNSVPRELIGTATALTAFFRLLGGAVGVAVLSSVVLGLLRASLPAGTGGVAGTGGLEVLTMLGAGGRAGDGPFRDTLLVGAVVALASVWCARHLPDVRLNERTPLPAAAD